MNASPRWARTPAARFASPPRLCGCVGFKPTYGRVSRYGLVAFASSLDQIGPFTGRARHRHVAGRHQRARPARFHQRAAARARLRRRRWTAPIKGLKLGLPKEYMIGGLDPEVSAAVQAAVKQFEKLGAEIVEISLPHTDYAVATYYIVATAEASANLARFRRHPLRGARGRR
jgi:aspartyl-tRNA(Asn)/glutamyl-tRNA(Gln) amidotransferase subunit A